MLTRFRLIFTTAGKIRNKNYMNEHGISYTDFCAELSCRFQEWLAFYVTDGTTDFRNHDIGTCHLSDSIDCRFNLICHMRDYLDSLSEISAFPFPCENIPEYPAACQIRFPIEILINKSLIMTKIKIRLSSIFSNKDLTMLIRAHRSRIDIKIRIKLLSRYFQPSLLQQKSKACCTHSLTKS